MTQPGFTRIQALLDQMSRSDQKIAQFILDNPTTTQRLTIQELANQVGVSTATISRFAKRVGFSSYREFSLSMTAPITDSHDGFFGEIEATDATQDIVKKVFSGDQNALLATYNLIPTASFEKACNWLINARKVGLFGIGGSSIVALDGYHKFLRTPLDVEQHPDYDIQLMQSVRMTSQDVALVISHSGRNRDTLKITRQLKENGVKIIAITAYTNSELASIADLVLASAAAEINIRSESMSSLIAQLAIMDSLFTLVGVSLGDDTMKIVETMRTTIESTRE